MNDASTAWADALTHLGFPGNGVRVNVAARILHANDLVFLGELCDAPHPSKWTNGHRLNVLANPGFVETEVEFLVKIADEQRDRSRSRKRASKVCDTSCFSLRRMLHPCQPRAASHPKRGSVIASGVKVFLSLVVRSSHHVAPRLLLSHVVAMKSL